MFERTHTQYLPNSIHTNQSMTSLNGACPSWIFRFSVHSLEEKNLGKPRFLITLL